MDLLELLGVAAGSILATGALARALWRINRRVVAVLGAVQELLPNGGRSIKDTVTRTEGAVQANTEALLELQRRLDEHLADGQGL